MISQAIATEREAPVQPKFSKNSSGIIRSLVELEEIGEEWQSLMSPEASPFQTFSWNCAWYRNFPDCYDEILIFIASNGSVIFPVYRKGKTLRLAGDVTCDYQDAIAKNISDVRTGFQELLVWSSAKNYDLNFRKLSTRGFLYRVIDEMTETTSHFKPLKKVVGPCPYFEIGQTSETRLEHLPRKFRAELRRMKRRLMEAFPETTLQFNRSPKIKSQDILEMVNFHSDNFRFSGANPLDDPRLRQLLIDIRNKPGVGLCVSRLGDSETTLAMDLIFIRGGRLYGYLTAFNCDHARLSPGSCLLTDRLDLLVEEENVKVIDFLCGSEPYKYRYAKDEYHVQSVRMIPRTPAGVVHLLLLKAGFKLRRLVKKALRILKIR